MKFLSGFVLWIWIVVFVGLLYMGLMAQPRSQSRPFTVYTVGTECVAVAGVDGRSIAITSWSMNSLGRCE